MEQGHWTCSGVALLESTDCVYSCWSLPGVVGWMEEGEDFRIGLTQTGSQVLLHQGYLYQVERSQASKVYWRCRNRRGKCRGRAIKIGSHVQITQQHSVCLPSV